MYSYFCYLYLLDIYKQYINREKSDVSIYGETIGLSWTMNKFPSFSITNMCSF